MTTPEERARRTRRARAERAERRRLNERLERLRSQHGYTDPNLGNAFETELDRPPPGPTSTRPDRLAIIVPYQTSEMNLGAAFAKRDKLDDKGITFRTADHIDFRTLTGGSKTTVTMGTPATQGEKTWDGTNLPRAVIGYGMGTESAAYRVAKHRVYVLSNTGDVIVRAQSAKTTVLQSKGGPTMVNSGGDIAFTAGNSVVIGAGDCALATPAWNAAWPTDAKNANLSAFRTAFGTFVGMVGAAQATLASCAMPIHIGKKATHGTSAKPVPVPTFQKVTAALAAAASVAWLAGGNVRIHGTNIVHAAADRNAGMWANVSASVIGGLIGVVMGTTADMKGLLHAGMFARVEAAISSARKVVVQTIFDDIECYGGTEVAIASNKSVSMQSDGCAQLNSEHEAVLYGKSNAFVLSEGHGLRVSPNDVTIARINSRRQLFDHAQQKIFITVNDNFIRAQKDDNDSWMWITKEKTARLAYDDSTYVDISTSQVAWKGKLHQLGS